MYSAWVSPARQFLGKNFRRRIWQPCFNYNWRWSKCVNRRRMKLGLIGRLRLPATFFLDWFSTNMTDYWLLVCEAWAISNRPCTVLLCSEIYGDTRTRSYKTFFSFNWSYAGIPTNQERLKWPSDDSDWLKFKRSFNWSWNKFYRIGSCSLVFTKMTPRKSSVLTS